MTKFIVLTALAVSMFLQTNSAVAQSKKEDPVLMTVAGDAIPLSEFVNIYHKNNSKEDNIDPKSIEEYLELFVNFKLKVQAALERKMDTVPAFISELEGYRKQLAQPYLIDQEVNEALIKEGYDRLNQDVKASHILVTLKPDATPADTLKAYNKIKKYRARAVSGKEKFADIMKVVDDPKEKTVIAENLGFFTAFKMVYKFETAAYNTPTGEVSEIIRSRYGYHIIHVIDKRPARGQIRVAHIMISVPKGATDEKADQAEAKANEIYQKLISDEDFSEMAKLYSDDKGSAKKGGALPWFGTGRMVPAFEDAAFDLLNTGDISKPTRTKYGWHIIKRLDYKGIASFDELKNEMKNMISKDGRAGRSKTSLIARLKTEYGYEVNAKAKSATYKIMDESFFKGQWNPSTENMTMVLFSLEDKVYSGTKKDYTQAEFVEFMKKNQHRGGVIQDSKEVVNGLFEKFTNNSIVEFEEHNLSAKYPEFRALMQEYKDGILLFELMDEMVWAKAVKDTAGLRAFYEDHKNDYMWEERVHASIYTCANEDVANQAKKLIKKQAKKGYSDDFIKTEINKASQLNLKIETGKFLRKENEVVDKVIWSPGVKEDVVVNGKIIFVNVKEKIAPVPKSLREAKGLITADYQNFLEAVWLEDLKSKYEVKINDSVLSQVN